MKIFGLLCTATLAITSTHAAECTREQIASTLEKAKNVNLETACASVTTLMNTATDHHAAAIKICSDKTCMSAIETLSKIQPDCTIYGQNYMLKEAASLSNIQLSCKGLGVDIDGSPTTSPVLTPMAPTTAPALATTPATTAPTTVPTTAPVATTAPSTTAPVVTPAPTSASSSALTTAVGVSAATVAAIAVLAQL